MESKNQSTGNLHCSLKVVKTWSHQGHLHLEPASLPLLFRAANASVATINFLVAQITVSIDIIFFHSSLLMFSKDTLTYFDICLMSLFEV